MPESARSSRTVCEPTYPAPPADHDRVAKHIVSVLQPSVLIRTHITYVYISPSLLSRLIVAEPCGTMALSSSSSSSLLSPPTCDHDLRSIQLPQDVIVQPRLLVNRADGNAQDESDQERLQLHRSRGGRKKRKKTIRLRTKLDWCGLISPICNAEPRKARDGRLVQDTFIRSRFIPHPSLCLFVPSILLTLPLSSSLLPRDRDKGQANTINLASQRRCRYNTDDYDHSGCYNDDDAAAFDNDGGMEIGFLRRERRQRENSGHNST